MLIFTWGCKKTLFSILLTLSFSLPCSPGRVSMSRAALWGAHMAKKRGRPLAKSQQGTKALGPTLCEEPNPANKHMNDLGSWSSPG